jgi:hypothetical protein
MNGLANGTFEPVPTRRPTAEQRNAKDWSARPAAVPSRSSLAARASEDGTHRTATTSDTLGAPDVSEGSHP